MASPTLTALVLSLRTLAGDPVTLHLPRQAARCPTSGCPIVLLLQGADLERQRYARFAAELAEQGFAVFVPDHRRRFPPVVGKPRLLADPIQIPDLLASLPSALPASLPVPLNGRQLLLVGHSMGGVAALNALRDHCLPPLCTPGYRRPPQLRGGVLVGTDLRGHGGGAVPPIRTAGRPVALWLAGKDPKSPPAAVLATYQQIEDRPRALFSLRDADHFTITSPEPAQLAPLVEWTARFLRGAVLGNPQDLETLRRPPHSGGLTVLFEPAAPAPQP